MLKSIEWQEALCSSFQQNEPPALLRGWSWSKTSFPPALSIFQRPPANKCHAGGSVPSPGAQVINRKPAAFVWHEETQQPCCWLCGGSWADCAVRLIQKVYGEFGKQGENPIAEGLLVLQESRWQVSVGTVWRCSFWGIALTALMCVTESGRTMNTYGLC